MTRNQISRVLNRTTAGRIQARTGSSGPGTAMLAVLFALAAVVPACAQVDTTADVVYGRTDFTAAYDGVISANTLSTAWGVTVDSGGNLYAVDKGNGRVLYYPAGSTTATRVYGQGGNFRLAGCSSGASGLCNPLHAALDSGDNLYIADSDNGRVLYYPAGSTTATRVYGQSGNLNSAIQNNGGVTANSLWVPGGVAVDSGGNLYVSDTNNNRVLYYPAGSTTATRV